MVDCHMHMVLDGEYWRAAIDRHRQGPDLLWIRQILARYQSQDCTYLRDGGDRWGVGAAARSMAAEFGIVYRTPLAPLCRLGHYGSFIGETYDSFAAFAAAVVRHKQAGADFIKIMISGLMDFNQYGILTEPGLPAQDIRELIHIAHQEGMAVMAHANGARTVEAAAAAGVDSVEHGAYLDADALAAMESMGTVWVPTLSTIGNLRGAGRFAEDAVTRILDSAMENVARFKGFLAPGTDAGAWQVPHAIGSEYTLLEQCGISQERLNEGTAKIRERF